MDQSEITGEREPDLPTNDREEASLAAVAEPVEGDELSAAAPLADGAEGDPLEIAAAGAEGADDISVADDEVPAGDPAASEVEAARLEADDAAARARQLSSVVEALLFASEEPLTVPSLKKVIHDATTDELKGALQGLKAQYDAAESGIALFEMAGGYLICTRDTYAPWVEKMIKGKRRVRLSRAGLETIAVVAYKQPISRAEIERIRGVDCGGVLGTLVERDLVMIKGRDTGPGKPLLYGTTQEFLNYFGLNKISELPRLDELATLAARNPAWSDSERARFQKRGVEEVQLELPGEMTGDAAEAAESAAAPEAAHTADAAGIAEAPDALDEGDAGYGDGHEANPA